VVETDATPILPAKGSANRVRCNFYFLFLYLCSFWCTFQNKRAKHHHKGDSPTFSPYQTPHSPQNGHSHSHTHGQQTSFSHSHSNQIAGAPHGRTLTTPDELSFFDRAKKALESRETYDEFLRLLNLFSKDIIDAKSLIQNAQVFLGDGDLFSQFKDLMSWDERLHSVEYGPPGSIRTGPPDALSAERTDEGQGISYRRLPASVSY
jgi:paired amphipathic helix protein Sin3a